VSRGRVVLVGRVVASHGVETLVVLVAAGLGIGQLLLVRDGELVCHIRNGEGLVVEGLVAGVGG